MRRSPQTERGVPRGPSWTAGEKPRSQITSFVALLFDLRIFGGCGERKNKNVLFPVSDPTSNMVDEIGFLNMFYEPFNYLASLHINREMRFDINVYASWRNHLRKKAGVLPQKADFEGVM